MVVNSNRLSKNTASLNYGKNKQPIIRLRNPCDLESRTTLFCFTVIDEVLLLRSMLSPNS